LNGGKKKGCWEVGCGIGTDTINFARAGALVTAVDLSNESLKLAQQRATVFGLENSVTFYQANAEELGACIRVS
jgi:ubiquinone/menaquinone biosynthesis C-methylase UbiE